MTALDTRSAPQAPPADAPPLPSFTVLCAELETTLKAVGIAVPARSPFPVHTGVLFTVTPDGATATGDDRLTTATMRMHTARVDGAGPLLVDHAELKKMIPALTHGLTKAKRDKLPATIRLTEAGHAELVLAGSTVQLETYPAEDYPAPLTAGTHAVTTQAARFHAEAKRVAVAASSDEGLAVLTFVLIQIAEDRVKLAATDRFRIACTAVPATPTDEPVTARALVDKRVLAAALPFLTGDELTIAVDDPDCPGVVTLDSGGFTVTTRLYAPQSPATDFPDYEQYVPSKAETRVDVDIAALTTAAKRAELVLGAKKQAVSSHAVHVRVDTDSATGASGVRLVADLGDRVATAPLVDATVTGVDTAFRALATLLLEGITCFTPRAGEDQGSRLSLHLPSGDRSFVITDRPDGLTDPFAYKYVLAPLRSR